MDDKLDKFKKVLSVMNEEFVTSADVAKVFNAVVKVIKDFKASVSKEMAKIQRDFASFTDRITKQVDASETRLTKKVDATERDLRTILGSIQAQLRTDVNTIRESTQDVPELMESLNRIEALSADVERLGELFTSENIRNMLELLEGKERLHADYIDGLDELEVFKKMRKEMVQLKGAAHVPSPMHVPTHEEFTMNGSDTSVTLQHAVGAAGNAVFNVTYQGQVLRFGENYTVNGNKITFVGFTPANMKIITVTYLP